MMTAKERFFREHLVPAGQVLEVLLHMDCQWRTRDDRVALSNAAFEVLNLAACYAMHPHTSDLTNLQVAVNNLTVAMVKALEDLGPRRAAYILEPFGVKHRGNSGEVQSRYVTSLHELLKNLPPLRDAIYAAIQYSPAKREEWLRTFTATTSALTAGGRTNRWRTFVRHLSWETAAGLMGVRAQLVEQGKTTNNLFSSSVGRAHAATLWSKVFSEPARVPTPASANECARPLAPLPDGVHVEVTPDKLLQVSVRFNPAALLGQDRYYQLTMRQKHGQAASAELAKALATRQFQDKTDVAGLATVVATAEAWLGEQRATEGPLHQLFDDWLAAMRLTDVRAKLDKHFSTEERALLMQALALPGDVPA
jgi:hypothetical protein